MPGQDGALDLHGRSAFWPGKEVGEILTGYGICGANASGRSPVGEGLRDSSYQWVILLLATLVQVGVSVLQQVPSALGPVLAEDLELTRAQIGLLSSAIWGGMLFTMLPVGILIDRFGERVVISIGVSAMAVLAFLASRADAFVWLFALFLLASLGASSSAPGGSKAIAAWFHHSGRGGAMGVRQTGVPIGGLVAAILLPPVAVRFGWEASLQTAAAITLATVVCFGLFYRERPLETEEPPRPPIGSFLRNTSFLAVTGYAFVFQGALGSATSHLALSLNEEAGLSFVAAGAFLAVLQIGGGAGRIGWGAASDRMGRRMPVMLLIGLIATGSCLVMASVDRPTAMPLIVLLSFLLGCSVMGWNALHLTLITEATPSHAAATAMGLSLTIAFAGMFLVPPLFGLVADLTGSYAASWLALAGWVALGTALGLLVRESPQTFDPA